MTTVNSLELGSTGDGPSVAPQLAAQPLWKKILTLPHLLTAAYLALCAPLIFTHAIWIDEAQAFVLARDSRSIGELFHNMRYEGHPPLWHFLLWIITRFTTSIVAMQALHLALATAGVYLVVRFSPFPLPAKILFPFGYFSLFEYGIISRNYQLVMLLAFAFCALWQRRRTSYAWLGLFLALLCLSHVIGDIIAAALGVMLLADALTAKTSRAAIAKKPWIFALGLVLALGGAGAAVALLKPPPDYGYATVSVPRESNIDGQMVTKLETADWYNKWDFKRAQETAAFLSDGLLPLPKHTVHFWDSANIIDQSPGAALQGVTMAVIALLMVIRSWRASLFYVIATLGLLAFCYLKFPGNVRHHGGLFITLLAAFWIAWSQRDSAPPPLERATQWLPRLALVVFLAVHVYSAAVVVFYLWQVPFAAGKSAAAAIRKVMQPGDLLVADMEYATPTISAYLPGNALYAAGTKRYTNFIVYLRGRPDSRAAGFSVARQFANDHHAPVIWITRSPASAPGATFIGSFDPGGSTLQDARFIKGTETYVIYRILPAGSTQ